MSDQTTKKEPKYKYEGGTWKEIEDFLEHYEQWYAKTQGASAADEGGSPTPPPPPPPGSGFGGH